MEGAAFQPFCGLLRLEVLELSLYVGAAPCYPPAADRAFSPKQAGPEGSDMTRFATQRRRMESEGRTALAQACCRAYGVSRG